MSCPLFQSYNSYASCSSRQLPGPRFSLLLELVLVSLPAVLVAIARRARITTWHPAAKTLVTAEIFMPRKDTETVSWSLVGAPGGDSSFRLQVQASGQLLEALCQSLFDPFVFFLKHGIGLLQKILERLRRGLQHIRRGRRLNADMHGSGAQHKVKTAKKPKHA